MEGKVTRLGFEMVLTDRFNWKIETENRDGTGEKFCVANVGRLNDMYQIFYNHILNYVSVTKIILDDAEKIKFKVRSLEDATNVAVSFCHGMDIDYRNTIHDPKFKF